MQADCHGGTAPAIHPAWPFRPQGHHAGRQFHVPEQDPCPRNRGWRHEDSDGDGCRGEYFFMAQPLTASKTQTLAEFRKSAPALAVEYTDPVEGFRGWFVRHTLTNRLCAGGMRVQPGTLGGRP